MLICLSVLNESFGHEIQPTYCLLLQRNLCLVPSMAAKLLSEVLFTRHNIIMTSNNFIVSYAPVLPIFVVSVTDIDQIVMMIMIVAASCCLFVGLTRNNETTSNLQAMQCMYIKVSMTLSLRHPLPSTKQLVGTFDVPNHMSAT